MPTIIIGGEELVDLEGVAVLFGRKKATVNNWRYMGILPPADVTVGRTPAWYPDRLRAWGIESGRLLPDGSPIPWLTRTP